MMRIKKRHPIRDSDIRDLADRLKPQFGIEIENLLEGRVETAELESGESIILVDGEPILVEKDILFPFTSAADKLSLKRVTVDMGAVKPISDGADVMAPGIVEVEDGIEEGEIIGIEDEKNRKIIAIGETLVEEDSLKGKEGKVVRNLHYVGDKYWSILEEF